MNAIRMGHGFDAHRFTDGRRLVLAGVEIPFERGLAGHSDADVAAHTVMDAILGALALGDIGVHFPPGDPRWKDADSMELLRKVAGMAAERGWTVAQVDVTIIAEQPKISGHTAAMRKNIAEAAGAPEDAVSVKATTTEGMGFTGRGEGIAALATALLQKDDRTVNNGREGST